MQAPLKLGVFGYGFIAGVHVDALHHVEGVEVAAVCGPRAAGVAAFAHARGIAQTFSDPDAMLARDDIAAVLVDTPDVTHYDLVMRAIRAGKHVFCEKPLARTAAEAREMYAAARAAHRRTLVGFSMRWNATVNQMSALVAQDELGEIVHVHGQSFNAGLIRSERPRFTWRTDAARTGTGILGDLGAHYVDLTHYLLGPIAEVCADLRTVISEVYDAEGVAHPHRVDDDTVLLLRLARGAHGALAFSRLGSVNSDYPVGRRHYLIEGRKGGLLYENGQAWRYRPGQAGEPLAETHQTSGGGHADALLGGAIAQMETFIRAIREDRDIGPTFRDGLACQEVLDAAVASSLTRAWIPVPAV